MRNKIVLLCIMLAAELTGAAGESLPRFVWNGMDGAPDLSWVDEVGAKSYPVGKNYNVADFGLGNDTTILSTKAIQEAIDLCNANGGGTVEVPAGHYRIGAIYLKSNVNLRLSRGCTLIADENISLYPEMRSRIAGIEMRWPSAVINVIDADNAAISGEGTIDCRGKIYWDKYWIMRREYERKGLRWIVDYDCKRVRGVIVSGSSNVTLRDFTLIRTGFWGCQVLYSTNCTLSGLTVNNNIGGHGPSTDGIDIDSSRDIMIEDCYVDCNDDNICLKAGRDADGLRVNRPTENVVVRRCTSHRGGGLITCGSETSGGIRNVLGYDLKACGTSSVMRLKSAMTRGGTVENIYMAHVEADSVRNILAADLNWNPSYSYSTLPPEYEGLEIPEHWQVMLTKVEPKEKGFPHFRNIWLGEVKATACGTFIHAKGMSVELPLSDFHVLNIEAEVSAAGTVAFTDNFHITASRLKVGDGSRVVESDNTNSCIQIEY